MCSTRGGYFAQLTFDPGGQATLPLGWSRRSKIWTRPSFLAWGEHYIFPETLYWDIHNLLPKECFDSWRIHYSGSLGIGEYVMKPYVTYPRSSALIETLFGTSCQLQRIFGKRMWKDVEKRFDFAQLQHPKTTWTSLWFNASCLASAAPTAKCGFGRWFMVLPHTKILGEPWLGVWLHGGLQRLSHQDCWGSKFGYRWERTGGLDLKEVFTEFVSSGVKIVLWLCWKEPPKQSQHGVKFYTMRRFRGVFGRMVW